MAETGESSSCRRRSPWTCGCGSCGAVARGSSIREARAAVRGQPVHGDQADAAAARDRQAARRRPAMADIAGRGSSRAGPRSRPGSRRPRTAGSPSSRPRSSAANRDRGALVPDGPLTRVAFSAYPEQFLAPRLAPGDVVVLDDLATARSMASAKRSPRLASRSSACRPTVPDFVPGSQRRPPRSVQSGTPIGQLFARLKALLRKPPPAPEISSGRPSAACSPRVAAKQIRQLPRPRRLGFFLK